MQTFRAQAIVFDNDGVLVDSHPQVIAAWTAVANAYRLPVDQVLAEVPGVRSLDTLGRYLDGDELIAANQRLEDLEVAYADRTEPLAGALDLIESLPDGRWTIAT